MLGEMISEFRVIAAAYDKADNVIAVLEDPSRPDNELPGKWHVAQLISKGMSLRWAWQIADDSQTCWTSDEQTVWEEFGDRTA